MGTHIEVSEQTSVQWWTSEPWECEPVGGQMGLEEPDGIWGQVAVILEPFKSLQGNSSPFCLQCLYKCALWHCLGYSEWRLRFMPYSRPLLQLSGFAPGNIWNGAVATSGGLCSVVVTHHKHSPWAQRDSLYKYTTQSSSPSLFLTSYHPRSHSWWRSQKDLVISNIGQDDQWIHHLWHEWLLLPLTFWHGKGCQWDLHEVVNWNGLRNEYVFFGN